MHMEVWLLEHGAYAIFFLLALGIVGLPIPDETIIVIAGALVSRGKLPLIPVLFAIYAGGLSGITLSYLLGYTGGDYLIKHYGYLLHLKQESLEKAKCWFKDIGKWVLFFGYFILGIRHLAGFVAGTMKLRYLQFAIFAYSGLFVWASAIFSLGYFFSKNWHRKLNFFSITAIIISVCALGLIYAYFLFQKREK